jgi:hypothetical protein
LIVGGEDHKTGQADDAGERHARLVDWTRERFPVLGEPLYRWSGQVMEPVDGLAFIGRNPGDRNVYIVTGDSGNGMTHGTIAGMLLGDLIASRTNAWAQIYDPSPKNPDGADDGPQSGELNLGMVDCEQQSTICSANISRVGSMVAVRDPPAAHQFNWESVGWDMSHRPFTHVVSAVLCLLTACSTPRLSVSDAPLSLATPGWQRDELQKTRFYWPYAALAAEVYASKGESETRLPLISASPWLRSEIASADDETRRKLESIDESEIKEIYKAAVEDICRISGKAVPTTQDGRFGVEVYYGNCENTATRGDTEQAIEEKKADAEDNSNRRPTDVQQCAEDRPGVGLDEAKKLHGWEPVKEIEKYTISRGWRVFVPDLAIDVWRRKRTDLPEPKAVEYAIVYRGTAGSGGWVSNLRILTAALPLFWDHYLQAERATQRMVEQIYMLHLISDKVAGTKERTAINITTVGHSLGAGIATYMYYAILEITRVVGFNSSPIDGSRSVVQVDKRQDHKRRRAVDYDRTLPMTPELQKNPPAIYLLYEQGEVLSRLHSCQLGATTAWGDAGGPVTLCEQVNLSSGSWFKQHKMNTLACKLSLIEQGKPAKTGPASQE